MGILNSFREAPIYIVYIIIIQILSSLHHYPPPSCEMDSFEMRYKNLYGKAQADKTVHNKTVHG